MALYTFDDCVLVAVTDKAWLIRQVYDREEDIPDEFADGETQWWIPISMIEDTDLEEIGDQGYVEVPLWLAKQNCMPDADGW